MPNVFLPIVVPALAGFGAAVDISTLGFVKLFSLAGTINGSVNIQISNDGVNWVTVATLPYPNDIKLSFAAQFVRAQTIGSTTGATLSIGSNDPGTQMVAPAVPAGNGTGVAVDASALGIDKTFLYSGGMEASINIEISQDGGVTFSPAVCFSGTTPARINFCGAMDFIRAVVSGYQSGTATVSISAVNDASSESGFVPMAGPLFAATTVRSGIGIYVNPIDPNAADDGNPNTPKLTIQGALDCIPAPADADEAYRRWTIFVAPGLYEENLDFPSGQISVVALGGVQVTGDVAINTDAPFAIPSQILITSVSKPPSGSPFDNGAFEPFIILEGNISAAGDPETCFLFLEGVRVTGNLDTTGAVGATVTAFFNNCVLSTISMSDESIIRMLDRCRLLGAIAVGQIDGVRNSEVSDVTITNDGGDWYNTEVAGTITVGGTISVDASTNASRLENFAVFAGAGVVLIRDTGTVVGVWGSPDIGNGVGDSYLPPGFGAVSATDDFGFIIGRRTTLYTITARRNTALGNGGTFTLQLLVNGIVVATFDTPVITGGIGQTLTTVRVPALVDVEDSDVISVRASKGVDIGSGALGLVVTLHGFSGFTTPPS